MLSHEWRELEAVCDRIGDLRHRLTHAQRTKNTGLLQGLKDSLELAQRQREQLVQHISQRLGSVAADHVATGSGKHHSHDHRHGHGHQEASQPPAAHNPGTPQEPEITSVTVGFRQGSTRHPR